MHRCNGELGQLLMARRPGVAELANGGRVAVRQGDHETPWSLRRPGVHPLGIAMGRPGGPPARDSHAATGRSPQHDRRGATTSRPGAIALRRQTNKDRHRIGENDDATPGVEVHVFQLEGIMDQRGTCMASFASRLPLRSMLCSRECASRARSVTPLLQKPRPRAVSFG